MKGRVIGELWVTKRCEALAGYSLKLVAEEPAEGARSGRVLVAVDTLDAERGRAVLVAFGSAARNALRPGAGKNRDLLCDCAVVQVIDGETPGTGRESGCSSAG